MKKSQKAKKRDDAAARRGQSPTRRRRSTTLCSTSTPPTHTAMDSDRPLPAQVTRATSSVLHNDPSSPATSSPPPPSPTPPSASPGATALFKSKPRHTRLMVPHRAPPDYSPVILRYMPAYRLFIPPPGPRYAHPLPLLSSLPPRTNPTHPHNTGLKTSERCFTYYSQNVSAHEATRRRSHDAGHIPAASAPMPMAESTGGDTWREGTTCGCRGRVRRVQRTWGAWRWQYCVSFSYR